MKPCTTTAVPLGTSFLLSLLHPWIHSRGGVGVLRVADMTPTTPIFSIATFSVATLVVVALFIYRAYNASRGKKQDLEKEAIPVEVVIENNVDPLPPPLHPLTPAHWVPIHTRPRRPDPTLEQVKAYMLRIPEIYDNAVADGRADEVEWMDRSGLLDSVRTSGVE